MMLTKRHRDGRKNKTYLRPTCLNKKLKLVLPKSVIGQAVANTLTLWPRLIRFIDEGRFRIDNNLIENSIRPVALSQKNYMFAGSIEAAQQAAIIYSLLATCKINDIEPLRVALQNVVCYIRSPCKPTL